MPVIQSYGHIMDVGWIYGSTCRVYPVVTGPDSATRSIHDYWVLV